jgi:LPS sulfotransferase NodH
MMFDGVATGYEDRFDFPHRSGPPERVYTLATVPRTGSTYVSHVLWRSGCLGAPLEYLNFLAGSPFGFAHGQLEKQSALWRSVLHRRTSPNGVFGVKCFSTQLRELQQAHPQLLLEVFATMFAEGRSARVVRLKRRDRIAHAISYARAALSGVWRKEQEAPDGTTAEYSAAAVDHARALIDREESDWDLLLKDVGVEPLTLWYEDVLADPEAAVRAVAALLEVELDPAAAIAVPPIEKQSEQDSKRWAERYGGAG